MPMSHPSSPALPRTRGLTAAAVVLAAGLLLTGCTQTDGAPGASGSPTPSDEAPAPSATPSETPSAAPSATPDASASATPDAVVTPSAAPTAPPTAAPGVPVAIACDALVPAQALYDFNPNFSVDPGYQPAAGTLPAAIAASGGVACGYRNQTSGEVIEVAVAHPAPAVLQGEKDAVAAASQAVPFYGGDAGYYGTEAGQGIAQAFTGEYRVVARSAAFLDPTDPADLMTATIATVSSARP
ncbi:hypothetical protein [Planctomonas deserti]|uniref:hypothetical protein n=1 Tax=Planctomonas deserti TaxID=2144185 RepID=UPI000D354848|nr:hypothetical protein [Planctomonas deserti]